MGIILIIILILIIVSLGMGLFGISGYTICKCSEIADMVTVEFCESKEDLGLSKMFDDQSGLVINCEES